MEGPSLSARPSRSTNTSALSASKGSGGADLLWIFCGRICRWDVPMRSLRSVHPLVKMRHRGWGYSLVDADAKTGTGRTSRLRPLCSIVEPFLWTAKSWFHVEFSGGIHSSNELLVQPSRKTEPNFSDWFSQEILRGRSENAPGWRLQRLLTILLGGQAFAPPPGQGELFCHGFSWGQNGQEFPCMISWHPAWLNTLKYKLYAAYAIVKFALRSLKCQHDSRSLQ